MEKSKNDEKAKHAHRPDFYSQGCAFSVIVLMFLLLTIMTSYATFSVLPVPIFYYYGSLILGMLIFGFLHTLGSAWRDIPVPLKWHYILAVMLICSSCMTWQFFYAIGVAGSWIIGIIFFSTFREVPAFPVAIFPLLMIVTICTAILFSIKSIDIPRPAMKMLTYMVVLFASIFIWGNSLYFEGHVYDEGLKGEGTSYHAIVYYGWVGDPGLIYLYECDMGIFGCNLIYKTDTFQEYRADETRLVYDVNTNTLILEYTMSELTARYYEIPPILYEYPVR